MNEYHRWMVLLHPDQPSTCRHHNVLLKVILLSSCGVVLRRRVGILLLHGSSGGLALMCRWLPLHFWSSDTVKLDGVQDYCLV